MRNAANRCMHFLFSLLQVRGQNNVLPGKVWLNLNWFSSNDHQLPVSFYKKTIILPSDALSHCSADVQMAKRLERTSGHN